MTADQIKARLPVTLTGYDLAYAMLCRAAGLGSMMDSVKENSDIMRAVIAYKESHVR